MAWYRAYPGMAADPKFAVIAKVVGGTSRGEVLQVWVRCLEHMAERGNLTAFKAEEESITLGLPEELVTSIITQFTDRDMIDGVAPTAWNRRQYKSDSSTERSQRSRDNKKQHANGDATDVQRPPTVAATPVQQDATPPDTDSESDTDSEEQKEPQPPTEVAPLPPVALEKSRKGTRLADSWEPSPEDLAYADRQGFSAEAPFDGGESPAGQVYMDFRDYFTTGKGRNETNANWDRRAKKWVRDQVKFKPPGGQIAGRSDRPRTGTEALRNDAEFRAAAARLVGSGGGGNGPADAALAAGGPHGGDDRGAGQGGGEIHRRALPKPAGRGVDLARGGDPSSGRMPEVSAAGRAGDPDRSADVRREPGAGLSRADAADQGTDRPRDARDSREAGRADQNRHGIRDAGGSEQTGSAGALDAYEREHGIPRVLHRNVA